MPLDPGTTQRAVWRLERGVTARLTGRELESQPGSWTSSRSGLIPRQGGQIHVGINLTDQQGAPDGDEGDFRFLTSVVGLQQPVPVRLAGEDIHAEAIFCDNDMVANEI